MNFLKIKKAFFHRYNRLLLWRKGIVYSRSSVLNGPIHWNIGNDTVVSIGSEVHLNSGLNINPLCSDRIASIFIRDNGFLEIGSGTGLSSPIIWCAHKIIIGDHCVIGANVTFIDTNVHSLDPNLRRDCRADSENAKSGVIEIGNDVFIGEGCLIMKGAKIGDRAIIGARSIIKSKINSDELVQPGTVK